MLACARSFPFGTFAMFGLIAASAAVLAVSQDSHSMKVQPSSADYGKIPLGFEANQGQADPNVKFLSRGNGYSLFLTDSSALLALDNDGDCSTGATLSVEKQVPSSAPCDAKTNGHRSVVSMTLVGASVTGRLKGFSSQTPNPYPAGEDQLSGKVNYFIGKDPAKWRTDIPTYAKVHYPSVYPGVDLIYYGNQRELEYDFVVSPGVDPASIQLSFTGEKHMRITADGDLILESEYGSATFHKPIIYQQRSSQRKSISGDFQLVAKNTVGFKIGSYDHALPLVIDPVLVYSTYLGGSGAAGNGDQGNGIAVDAAGNAYVVGTTYSADFPITSGAFQQQNNGTQNKSSNIFISKLNATGTALVYSTYLGGSGGDEGYGIALDSAGNAYVTGATYSQDFPVTCDSFQTVNYAAPNGDPTAFVAKLNPTGSALAYSTYLGGRGNDATPTKGDVAEAIAVDAAGNAYLTGYTYSIDFPVTDHAFQTQIAGASTSNAFVTKLNPGGTALAYSTLLGGSGSNGIGDFGNAIAIDTSGDAFIAGSTASANFPVTAEAYQASLNGSSSVAFVTELNPTGTDEVFSTYLGGTGGDSANAIVVGSSGQVYVAGNTRSSDFPVTVGVLEGANVQNPTYLNLLGSIGAVGFVTRLNQSGSALQSATYLGGAGTSVTGLAVDQTGATYITGRTGTAGANIFAGFQTTADALPLPTSMGTTAFLVKLNPSSTALNYATLFGGSANDNAEALALDSAGNVYITGYASSADFPVTNGVFQRTNKAQAVGTGNAFVGKFTLTAEANETAYPTLPVEQIPISMSILSEEAFTNCGGEGDEGYSLLVSVTLNSGISGPPPTGSVVLTDENAVSEFSGVSGTWGATEVDIALVPGYNILAPGSQLGWCASYGGDAVYQPSQICDSAFVNSNCNSSQKLFSRPVPTGHVFPIQRGLRTVQDKGPSNFVSNPKPMEPSELGPKFTPSLTITHENREKSLSSLSAGSQGMEACINPKMPILNVTVNSWSRSYGAINPSFTYRIAGLLNGDIVTVTPSTTATPGSPFGTYPITATVTGTATARYRLIVVDGTLTVRKVQLSIVATGEQVTYGQTPKPPSAYTLAGFVNGDTASVVSGAPVLSTTVTSTTAVGYYPIKIGVGTLTATNYSFAPFVQQGNVQVIKAPLTAMASHKSIPMGGLIPTLTYSLTGFVNGDTAANSVTGVPVLTTSATTHSRPGSYPIYASTGTLASSNYHIVAVNGVLEVRKAQLTIIATSEKVTFGKTPAPLTAYTLIGFVNGDTVKVVSGSPVLTTTVTPATPVGYYNIKIGVGTLASANYTFGSSGQPGVVQVVKAPLTLKANNLLMPVGGPVPALTYSLTGFVNGDGVASSITGKPVLSTTATTHSKPGNFPIYASIGTMASTNYHITAVGGTMTIAP